LPGTDTRPHDPEEIPHRNSNYSVVFRWWDPLHRTLRLDVPQADIRIGVAAYTRDDDNSPGSVLWLPFRSQRPYWQTPDGRASTTRPRRPGTPVRRRLQA